MLLIPELETVVILVPRTGSGSLKTAVQAKYPKAMLLYRHMEADGVPFGDDRWCKVGVLRHPVHRLWSVYKYMRDCQHGEHEPGWVEDMRRSASVDFNTWIMTNRTPFTNPYDSAHRGRYWPKYSVHHSLAENRKSQFMYLRPDLGTQVFHFSNLHALGDSLGVRLAHRKNATGPQGMPALLPETQAYVDKVFWWDFDNLRPAYSLVA